MELTGKELQAMLWVLKTEGFVLPALGRPLNKTEQPVSLILFYHFHDHLLYLFVNHSFSLLTSSGTCICID